MMAKGHLPIHHVPMATPPYRSPGHRACRAFITIILLVLAVTAALVIALTVSYLSTGKAAAGTDAAASKPTAFAQIPLLKRDELCEREDCAEIIYSQLVVPVVSRRLVHPVFSLPPRQERDELCEREDCAEVVELQPVARLDAIHPVFTLSPRAERDELCERVGCVEVTKRQLTVPDSYMSLDAHNDGKPDRPVTWITTTAET